MGTRRYKPKLSFLTILAVIVITLPIGVYYISQQNTNLTDQRNKAAWNNVYYECSTKPNSCTKGYSCQCVDGPNCTKTACLADKSSESRCTAQGGLLCPSNRGKNKYVCCRNGETCYPNGLPGCKRK